jgi:hypothetical protein
MPAPKTPKVFGKGRPLAKLKPGAIVSSGKVNVLIDFYNAFINGTVVKEEPPELHIGNSIIFKVGKGVAGNPDDPTGTATGGSERFKITDDFTLTRDYFQAIKWNSDIGAFDETKTINIAKHVKHRPTIVSETIEGSGVTYVYDDNFHRTTSLGGDSQKEQLFPLPQTDHVIYCSKLLSPDDSITVAGDDVPEWVDITPRVWARLKFEG